MYHGAFATSLCGSVNGESFILQQDFEQPFRHVVPSQIGLVNGIPQDTGGGGFGDLNVFNKILKTLALLGLSPKKHFPLSACYPNRT